MTPTLTSREVQEIHHLDSNYPARLKDLYDPPETLYIYGDIELLKRPMIAIVGSRMASPRGMRNAALFARGLSEAGILVLSGLARGIDGAAHRACLELGVGANWTTIAVCGTGVDVVYPREHQDLAYQIGSKGLILSELAPGMGPKAFHFPKRNRLIAALSLGVVVIEAADKSGSLITARLATDLGREVFALPGPIHDPLHEGCHRLIQEGAKLVCHPKEVLEDLLISTKTLF
jgi:DNA processing protein